jgi:predicted ATPase
MLTRLQVSGFKNLDGIDVRFGPFTCIAGANGVGKSNLFDAIAFLAALADKPLAEAAASIRGTEGRLGDVRSLFQKTGSDRVEEMSFIAEMIIPEVGTDDLGAEAKAGMTFLRYTLRLRYDDQPGTRGPLEIVEERMDHINRTGAAGVLGFDHKPAWRESVIKGRRTVPYIETIEDGTKRVVRNHADSVGGNGGGGARSVLAAAMPRTVLSSSNNASEHRTLVLARREMLGWTQFQLEPSALRAPDAFNAPPRIASNGAHLAAALNGLARDARREGSAEPEDVYQEVANRLAELFEDVRTLRIDQDDKRELYSIVLTDLQGTDHPASSLSDGTLRFLALAILQASQAGPSLLCLEEPENGIHPERIPEMIDLLRQIAVDVREPAGPDNPMRQVIINTHSPAVVNVVPQDTLVIAEPHEVARQGRRTRLLKLRGLNKTWRADTNGASIRTILAYLPALPPTKGRSRKVKEARLRDREDVCQLGLGFDKGPGELT